jgi:thiol:disulfide interchange protein
MMATTLSGAPGIKSTEIKKQDFTPSGFKVQNSQYFQILKRKASPYTLAQVKQESAKAGKELKQITIVKGASTKYGLAYAEQNAPDPEKVTKKNVFGTRGKIKLAAVGLALLGLSLTPCGLPSNTSSSETFRLKE